MRITNKHNLPPALVAAVANDPYSMGEADISCTALVGPVMIRHLRSLHEDDIEEDAVDRIWALLGQAVHSVLERAATPAELQEERLFGEWNGRRVSGQFDLFDGETVTDFKVTSVWAVKEGVKPEWVAQLNVLAALLRRYGFEPRRLEVLAILRDWRRNETRYDGYPGVQVKTFATRMPWLDGDEHHGASAHLDVPLWTPEQAEGYITGRLAAHFDHEPRICTPAERWDRPAVWAVHRKGRKSALRLLPTEAEALEWMALNGGDTVVHRPGASVRCQPAPNGRIYCPVARWCEYGKQYHPNG